MAEADRARLGMRGAADAAARRVILRASRSLRQGASREAVIDGYGSTTRRWRSATARPGAAGPAGEVATELDRWLRAAGFEPTEGSIEITC